MVQLDPPNSSALSKAQWPDTLLEVSKELCMTSWMYTPLYPPVDLLFHRAQFCTTTRICTLLIHHALYLLACKAATWFIRSHQAPLHYLFHLAGVKPQHIKTISPSTLYNPTYWLVLKTTICDNKEDAYCNATSAHNLTGYKVYCNSSGFKNGASTGAVLCIQKQYTH